MKENVKAMLLEMQQNEDFKELDTYMIDEVKNDKAFINNDLIKGMFEHKTITSLKLLLYIARVDGANNKLKGDYYQLKLDVNDICKYTNIKPNTLKDNLKKIQKTSITYFSTDERRKKGLIESVSLIPKLKYLSNTVLVVDMHSDILNMINETSNFTPFGSLKDIMQIKNVNSVRMLMLLTMINNQTSKRKKYTLTQLNFLFDTKYKTIYEFDRKILKPIKAELDINSSISFIYTKNEDYDKVGTGRKPIKDVTIDVIETNSLFSLDKVE